ncbi:MAG TPA: hypothetical protein VF846_14785 [Thermoanaerobaculia bacterium]
MRILSKASGIATAVALTFCAAGCARLLPWRGQVAAPEINLAFTMERNLIELQTVQIDGRPGRFLLGSAAPTTVLDPTYAAAGTHTVHISEKETMRINPVSLDLGGIADGIIGADVWTNRAISIDYRSGLVTYQTAGFEASLMQIYRFEAEPRILVNVNGEDVPAVVDTTSPDTLVLPSTNNGRGTARIVIAGIDFGTTDVRYANVARARVGNRLLSRFLVTIDYGKKVVGLWRDPRISITPQT